MGVEGGVCFHELTPIAIVISAAVALIIGMGGWWILWWINRKLAKKEAALLLLLDREPLYKDDFFALWMMFRKDVDFGALAGCLPVGLNHRAWDDDRKRWNLPLEQRQWLNICSCFNYYEIIAIAIEEDAIDEQIVEGFLRPRFVEYVTELYPFIVATRTTSAGESTTWIAVENLARKWGAELDC